MKGILLALCSLFLVVPTVACAETWVLWTKTDRISAGLGTVSTLGSWKRVDAYESKPECAKRVEQLTADAAKRPSADKDKVHGGAKDGSGVVSIDSGDLITTILFACQPEGVNPR